MEYQSHNPVSYHLSATPQSGISGRVLSEPYGAYNTDNIAFARQSNFSDILASYRLAHQSSDVSSYSNQTSDILASNSFDYDTSFDHHDDLHINRLHNTDYSLLDNASIDSTESPIHYSTPSNQATTHEMSDQNIDRHNPSDLTSDGNASARGSSDSLEHQPDVDQEHVTHNMVDKSTEQQRLSSTHNKAQGDNPSHLAVAELINAHIAKKQAVNAKHEAHATTSTLLNTSHTSNKQTNPIPIHRLNRIKGNPLAGTLSSDTTLSNENSTTLTRKFIHKSARDTIVGELSDKPTDAKSVVGAKEVSRSAVTPVGVTADHTHAVSESIRYTLVDNRVLKNIDPHAPFADINIKDQPTMLRDFRQFLDDIGNDSIVRHARLVIRGDQNGELRLLIKPPELGVMRIKFSLHQNTVEGKFIVDNVLAKDIMERNIADIQRHLRDNGLESRGIEVSLQNNGNNLSNRSDRFGITLPNNGSHAAVVAVDTPESGDDNFNSHSYMKKNNTALIDLLA